MSAETAGPRLSERFDDALVLASRLHRAQVRKGSGVPYVSHLLAVTALVIEDGGDEDLAIAALMHDAVEDQGGQESLELVRRQYGDRVAHIVDGLSEDERWESRPWLERKRRQLERLAAASPEVLRVKAADALHNARAILADWERAGPSVWERFDRDSCPLNQLWYYAEVAQVVSRLGAGSTLPRLLCRTVDELRERTRPGCARPHEHPGAA